MSPYFCWIFKFNLYLLLELIFYFVHGPLLGAFFCWWTFSLLPSVAYGKYCWSAGLPACDFLILIFSGDRPSSGCDWWTGHSVFTFSKHLQCVFISDFYNIPLRTEGMHFSTVASAFIVCTIFADGHSDCCDLIGLCNLGLHIFQNS